MPAAISSPTRPEYLRDLGVAWMNRGHDFMQQGHRVSLEASLVAYNEAITTLRQLPIGENPSWANTLGAALMNRGQLLHRLHGVEQATVALGDFDEAAAILAPLCESNSVRGNPWPRRNLTGTFLNRASLLLDLGQFSTANTTAREAVVLAMPYERLDLIDADLSLKSRRCLCDALGRLLVEPGADQNALATEASDLVDESLALIRHWTGRHPGVFASLALRLFRYGTRLYRLHQSQFLAEFIQENLLADNLELRAIALAAIDDALADQLRDLEFLTIGDPASEHRLGIWRELSALRTRLAAWNISAKSFSARVSPSFPVIPSPFGTDTN